MQHLRKLDWSRAARILCFVIGCYSLVEYIDFGDPNYTVRNYLIYFLILLTAIVMIKNFITGKMKAWSYRVLMMYSAVLLVSIGLNRSLMDTSGIILFLEMLCMFFSITDFNGKTRDEIKREIQGYLFVFLCFVSFLNLITVILVLSGNSVTFFSMTIPQPIRLQGFFTNPNLLGIYSVLASVFSLYWMNRQKKQWLILLVPNMVVHCLCLYLSDSRTAQIALAFALLVLTIYGLVRWTWKSLIVMIGISAVIVTAIIINPFDLSEFGRHFSLQEKIQQLMESDDEEGKEIILNRWTSGRYSLWKESIDLGNQEWLLGNGVGTLERAASDNLGAESLIVKNKLFNCHNLFINAYYSTGAVGLIVVVVLLAGLGREYVLFVKNSKNQWRSLCLILAAISVFIYSMLDIGILFDFRLLTFFFWLISGAIVHLNRSQVTV